MWFPRLAISGFQLNSPFDSTYNCIAFAAGDFTRWWWPDPIYYWPTESPRSETVQSFQHAFSTLGYFECNDGTRESDYEKIAIFTLRGVPTHAARMLHDGKWASKLGVSQDIIHAEDGVNSNRYGEVACFMKRGLPKKDEGKKPVP